MLFATRLWQQDRSGINRISFYKVWLSTVNTFVPRRNPAAGANSTAKTPPHPAVNSHVEHLCPAAPSTNLSTAKVRSPSIIPKLNYPRDRPIDGLSTRYSTRIDCIGIVSVRQRLTAATELAPAGTFPHPAPRARICRAILFPNRATSATSQFRTRYHPAPALSGYKLHWSPAPDRSLGTKPTV